MSLARVVITAVTVEGHTKSQVARDYGITRFWVQTLVKQFEPEGEAAFQPRSRRPATSPRAISSDVAELVMAERDRLTTAGHDAGPEGVSGALCKRSFVIEGVHCGDDRTGPAAG